MKVNALHQKAMEAADLAFSLRLTGNAKKSVAQFRKAYDLEKQAALAAHAMCVGEPTQSVLLRSAATLAIECKYFREAEQLIGLGLSGQAPEPICEELRDLLENLHFHRHLDLRGMSLDPGEVHMTVEGPIVGKGIVEARNFISRVEIVEKLAARTVERRLNKPFRDHGRPRKDIAHSTEVYLAVQRAASYGVTIRIGTSQAAFDFMKVKEVAPSVVVEDILSGLELYNSDSLDALHQHIADDAYFRNFVGLAKRLAPDGKNISSVSFSSVRGKSQHDVILCRQPHRIRQPRNTDDKDKIFAEGTLKFADSTHDKSNKIGVVDDSGKQTTFLVPEGMMNDIVRPLWDVRVKVSGRRTKRYVITLTDIEPAS